MASARPRGTTNRNARGGSPARRARRKWLCSEAAGFGGDGQKVPCSFCGAMLTTETVTADRYPVAGCDGGTYARGNIRPACLKCNSADGGRIGNTRKLAMVQVWVDVEE
jgi:hypothetical protein